MLCFDLSAAVSRLNTGRIFSDVLLVDPGESVSDLLKVDVGAVQHNHSQEAAIAISAEDAQLDIAAKDILTQVLFSCLSKRLSFFGCVDVAKPHAEQMIIVYQRMNGIAIGYANNSRRHDRSGN